MEFEELYLKNGIRVILLPRPGVITHAALTILAGSRYEKESEQGLAHFIEHGLFKGTQKRKAFHVLNRLDSVGGELNAYTTKEEISVHASFMNEYLGRALEILSDIAFQSTFQPKEMEKEKEIIIDEIQSYKDSPVDSIFDEFEDLVFKNHPLGHPILGTEKTVRSFTNEDIQNYIKRNFVAEGVSLVIVGQYKRKILKRWLDKYFESLVLNKREEDLISTELVYEPKKHEFSKSQYQTHTIIGVPAYNYKSEKRVAAALLNNWLGGPTLNSRLSLNVREKYGYTYNIESNFNPFMDTGLFSIYFGTDQKHSRKTLRVVLKELTKLTENKMGVNQLNMAKVQLKGNMALGQESSMALANSLGKSALIEDRIETIAEIHKRIDQITASDILEVANELFKENELSILKYTQSESSDS